MHNLNVTFCFALNFSPLNVNRKIVAHENGDSFDEALAITDKNIPRLICDMFGDGNQSANLHITNVQKMYVIANNKRTDETPPPAAAGAAAALANITPATEKKKSRHNRRNRKM